MVELHNGKEGSTVSHILVCLGLFWIISFFLDSLLNNDYPSTPKHHSLIKTTTNAPAIINHLILTAIVIHPTQSPNSFYKKEPCMNRVCINFLDTNDSSHFSYCLRKSKLIHEQSVAFSMLLIVLLLLWPAFMAQGTPG